MNAAPPPLLKDFSDRLSPMVVKELRHGLRTRVFTSLLTVFQVCMILITGAGVLGLPPEVVNNNFWIVSLLTLLVALPLRGFGTVHGEIQGGTMDMLTLTSISALRIIFGKWMSLFSQTLLVASSLLPYMVARYYFGGVEIVREALALVVAVLVSGVCMAALVAFSSQKSLVLRLLLLAFCALPMFPVTAFIFMLINDFQGDRALRTLFSLNSLELTGIGAGFLLLSAYAVYVFLALGASRIAPVSEDHSSRKRKIHLAMLTLLSVAGVGLTFHSSEAAFAWTFVPSIVLTLMVGMDLLTEQMPRFPTVIQGLVKDGPATNLARLFYPGWVSGVWMYALLGGLCIVPLFVYWFRHDSYSFGEFVCAMCVVLLVPVVPVCLRINKTNLFANWWVVNIALAVGGMLLMMFAGISGAREISYLGGFTPLTTMISIPASGGSDGLMAMGLIFGICWAVAAFVHAAEHDAIYMKLEESLSGISRKTRHGVTNDVIIQTEVPVSKEAAEAAPSPSSPNETTASALVLTPERSSAPAPEENHPPKPES